MDKKLLKTREEIYKKCPGIYWEVSIFAIIFAIALTALDAVVPGLELATFGILFFPLLFATYITLFTIKYGGTVTPKSTFRISKSYFSRGNFGCFRLIRCFLHALLVYAIACSVFALFLIPIFREVNGQAFNDQLNQFVQAFYGSDSELLATLLADDSMILFYFECASSFGISAAVVAFAFGVTYNSLNVYLCANIPNASATYCTVVFNNFLKRKGKQYRKDFWSLNWPLFALLIFGMIGGYVLTIFIDIDFAYGQVISSMTGLLLIIPFAPFYFSGMEALFAKYNEDLKKASTNLTQDFLKNIRNNMQISEEDRAKIDELLSKKDDEQNTEENQEK